jgi:hypothetical protein
MRAYACMCGYAGSSVRHHHAVLRALTCVDAQDRVCVTTMQRCASRRARTHACVHVVRRHGMHEYMRACCAPSTCVHVVRPCMHAAACCRISVTTSTERLNHQRYLHMHMHVCMHLIEHVQPLALCAHMYVCMQRSAHPL